MKRRTFLAGMSASALGVSMARAQTPLPVIGFLSARAPEESAGLLAALRRGLAEHGAVEGQTVAIEYRWALGAYDRLPAMAQELVQRRVAAIVTVGGEAAARAAVAATKSIPIVGIFADDPAANGYVASHNAPGGNVTGVFNFSPTLEAKRLSLLRELAPKSARIGVLVNPNYPPSASQLAAAEQAARAVGLETVALRAGNDAEIEAAFATALRERTDVLTVTADPFFNTRSDRLVALAARHAIPTVYAYREYVLTGGLMSYGIDLREVYRLIGSYAGQVLKGTKPADLPIVQPVKFELAVNLKTAKTLGLTMPATLLASAEEVIE